MEDIKKNNGFTLIELMIVIAIIGILAAVAIPNFIAYRSKAFCSIVESDADNVASRIAAYFAIPAHTSLPSPEDLRVNTWVNKVKIDGNVAGTITITVTDASRQCPQSYRSRNDGWVNHDFVKTMQ